MSKKKIVLLGGGHGLSAILKSFIDEDYDTSIIISTTDNGGHTGLLRKEFDIPALGDIRRCLSEVTRNKILRKLLDYRFEEVHNIKDLSLGNLILLSLLDEDLESSLLNLKNELSLPITLLPSLNYSTNIYAKYKDNSIIKGEVNIPQNKKIKDIFYDEKTYITPTVKQTLKEADYIVISPGSLYTSILPILAIEDIKKIIKKSKAPLIYVSNIMTQNKETDGYSMDDIIKTIECKIKRKLDIVIASSSLINKEKRERYSYELSFQIKESNDKRIIYADLLDDNSSYIRHDSLKLKSVVKNILK